MHVSLLAQSLLWHSDCYGGERDGKSTNNGEDIPIDIKSFSPAEGELTPDHTLHSSSSRDNLRSLYFERMFLIWLRSAFSPKYAGRPSTLTTLQAPLT